jgi:3-phosphoshikimate 1-carboxyvinyltransferase
VRNDNYSVFSIAGNQRFSPASFEAEGDWSGAAFLLVAGAVAGEARVKGLDPVSSQADRAVISALSMAGAKITAGSDYISVSADSLKSFDFDISNCPDLAPPLTVLALACKGVTVLRGADRLVVKESNRGRTLEEAMNSIGGDVKFTGSTLEIRGGSSLSGGTVSSYNDHRIAMALACAGLICNGPVTIEGMECINKSYPGFTDDILSLGGNIRLIK